MKNAITFPTMPVRAKTLWHSQSQQNLGALAPAFAITVSLCSFNFEAEKLKSGVQGADSPQKFACKFPWVRRDMEFLVPKNKSVRKNSSTFLIQFFINFDFLEF